MLPAAPLDVPHKAKALLVTFATANNPAPAVGAPAPRLVMVNTLPGLVVAEPVNGKLIPPAPSCHTAPPVPFAANTIPAVIAGALIFVAVTEASAIFDVVMPPVATETVAVGPAELST